MIPRIAHFVFGLRAQEEPFHLLHYLAIESCRQVVQPDEIRLHVHHLPYGVYWDLARPLVSLARVDPIALPRADRRYGYAHEADVIRLDVLNRDGGLYADIDTIFHRPFPGDLWEAEAVIGRESPTSVSNALMMSEPEGWFVAEFRRRIIGEMDGTWSAHSCGLATRLITEQPDRVRVEPQPRFSPFDHTPEGLHALLEQPLEPAALDGTLSVHLMAHLWWDRNRRDFTVFSAPDVSEASLRAMQTPLARIAAPFLPEHGLF